MYAVMFQTNQGYFLAAEKDGGILVKDDPKELIVSQENSYNEFHNRGYEASMSACMHSIQFQPVVVSIPTTEQEVINITEPDSKLYRLSAISGYGFGWKLTKEAGDNLLKTSIKPRLISEETFKGEPHA